MIERENDKKRDGGRAKGGTRGNESVYGDTLPLLTSGVTELAGERQREDGRAHLLTHTYASTNTHSHPGGIDCNRCFTFASVTSPTTCLFTPSLHTNSDAESASPVAGVQKAGARTSEVFNFSWDTLNIQQTHSCKSSSVRFNREQRAVIFSNSDLLQDKHLHP